jgi:hypothetical protein
MDLIDYVNRMFPVLWEDRWPDKEGILKQEGGPFDGQRTHTRSGMYTLVKALRPERVLEIGSMGYHCSDVMAVCMNDQGIIGSIDSIDIRKGGYNGRHATEPQSKRVNPVFWLPHHTDCDKWKYDAPVEYPEFKEMENEDIFNRNRAILAEIAPPTGYDLILIDGDHSFNGASWDWKYAQLVCHSETVFVIDDIGDDRHKEVRAFWDSLEGVKKTELAHWNQAHPEFYVGLGVCQKK